MLHFDAFLIVDWSAAARPTTGSDSVWFCRALRHGNSVRIQETLNPPTRGVAVGLIADRLVSLAKRGRATLIGFDFPYAYPAGFAAALGLVSNEPWLAVWDEVSKHIVDEQNNGNNRFEVASGLNRRLTGGAGPFWGCPKHRRTEFLNSKKPLEISSCKLAEYRLTDSRIRGPQSPWKLYTAGSPGSQALMGIPAVRRLRYHAELERVSMVWPFETGFRSVLGKGPSNILIVHAEVYPSICKILHHGEQVKDRLQVEALAITLGEWDLNGELAGKFDCPEDLGEADRMRVEKEEGWILGVG